MKNRTPLLVHSGFVARRFSFITLIAAFFIVGGYAFGKTASCPCNPCTCSPCTCGSGGKGDKHHGKEKEHGHGGVGVGVNVDLSGVGQRKAEPNPFATTSEPSVSHTQEKTTKKHTPESTATTFDKVDLTSEKAKDLEEPDEHAGTPTGGGTVQISDETPSPAPQTQEKKKEKPKWPKLVQDWLAAKNAKELAETQLRNARDKYHWGLTLYWLLHSDNYSHLHSRCSDARRKAEAKDATQEDKNNADKICKEADKLLAEFDKSGEFQKTDDGQKVSNDLSDAVKAADRASAAEKEAGKNVDQATKDMVLEAEAQAAKELAEFQAAKDAAQEKRRPPPPPRPPP